MTIPALTIAAIALALLAGIALPIALFLLFRSRCSSAKPFWVGCGMMLLFAFLLESGFHTVILSSPAGAWIQASAWRYALYGGLMAGLFEETGRFLAFRTVLRPQQENDYTALLYGAGHGGFEALVVLGLTMLSNLALVVMVNNGYLDILAESVPADTLSAMTEQLSSITPALFLLSILERLSAVVLHLALSVLVWFAVKDRRWGFYGAAIVLHALVDALAALLNGVLPVLALELLILALSAGCAWLAWQVWQRYHDKAGAAV